MWVPNRARSAMLVLSLTRLPACAKIGKTAMSLSASLPPITTHHHNHHEPHLSTSAPPHQPTSTFGRYSDTGSTTCTACVAGYHVKNANAECIVCDAGKMSQTESEACDTCAAGTSSLAGAADCAVCPSGKSSVAGATSCLDCRRGEYAPKNGSVTCVECTKPLTTLQPGATECTAWWVN